MQQNQRLVQCRCTKCLQSHAGPIQYQRMARHWPNGVQKRFEYVDVSIRGPAL